MQLVTPPTQQSGCPSQTSTVPKLLSAHSDGVVDNSIVSVYYGPYVNIRYPVNSGSGRIADSTMRPLSSSRQTVEIPIQYITT